MLNLTLVNGAKKHQIIVAEDTTVQKLREIVSEKTMIPEFNQKLIYKGVAITKNDEKTILELKIKDNSKIMVIGQRHDLEEENILERIDGMNKRVEKVDKAVVEVLSDFDSLQKGFMEKNLIPNSVERLKKCVLRCTEDGMKVLESLDEIRVDEKFKDARTKRKQLVIKAQTILDKCDKLADDIANFDAK